MQLDLIAEARRQAAICNACRYCEGYCSVFPELHSKRLLTDGDITHLANLCHNCRGCYYACQYTAPHEFDLNFPKALAEVRQASWEDFAWPKPVAQRFQRHGVAIVLATIIGFAVMFVAIRSLPGDGDGFYSLLSHSAMVSIFLPAFILPLISVFLSVRRYWAFVDGSKMSVPQVWAALKSAGNMKNLSGGHGDGCNFEDEDRFSHARRHAHQAVMWGFLLCFASTASGTVLHYCFGLYAPYGPVSLPKLLGVPGGILMVIGTVALAGLKLRADRNLSDASAWGGEMAYILLLFLVAATGLALYWAGSSIYLPTLLALHLGTVLTFFLLLPYTKTAHVPFRLAALISANKVQ